MNLLTRHIQFATAVGTVLAVTACGAPAERTSQSEQPAVNYELGSRADAIEAGLESRPVDESTVPLDADRVAELGALAIEAIGTSRLESIKFRVVDETGKDVDPSPLFELLGERINDVELVLVSSPASRVTDTRVDFELGVEVLYQGARWAVQPDRPLAMSVDARAKSPEHFVLSLESACALLATFHDPGFGCALARKGADTDGPASGQVVAEVVTE